MAPSLQGAAQPPKSGTYKLPKAIKVDTRSRRYDQVGSQQYYSQDCQDTNATNQLSSSESYCLQTVGNEYRGVEIWLSSGCILGIESFECFDLLFVMYTCLYLLAMKLLGVYSFTAKVCG